MKLAQSIACAVSALCIATPAVAAETQKSGSPPSATSSSPGSAADQKRGLRVKQGQTRKQTFDQLDTNRDGMISRSEAQASPALVLIFVETDTNKDDQLSPTEFVLIPIVQEDGTAAAP
jgi:hypothetical protein